MPFWKDKTVFGEAFLGCEKPSFNISWARKLAYPQWQLPLTAVMAFCAVDEPDRKLLSQEQYLTTLSVCEQAALSVG